MNPLEAENAANDIIATLMHQAEERGISRKELADRSGLSYSTIHLTANNKIARPSLATFLQLAHALDIPLEDAINNRPPHTITIAGHTYTRDNDL